MAYNGEADVMALLPLLRNPGQPQTDAGREMVRSVIDRYRHLRADLLLNVVLDRIGNRGCDYFIAVQWDATIRALTRLTTDQNQLAETMCRKGELLLACLDRTGPFFIQHPAALFPGYSHSYTQLLYCFLPSGDEFPAIAEADAYRRLRALYDAMSRCRLPAAQILGRGGQLWADIQLQTVSDRQIDERLREILEFFQRKVADPGGEQADIERTACYEAMLCVCNVVRGERPSTKASVNRVLDFMVSRKELLFCTVYAAGQDRLQWLRIGALYPYAYRGLNVSDEKMLARLLPLRKLMASGKSRSPDGNRAAVQAVFERLDRDSPLLAAGGGVPWTRVRKLIEFSAETPWSRFSKPAIEGDHAFLVAVEEQGGPTALQLLRIRLADGAVKRVSRLALLPGGTGEADPFQLRQTHERFPLSAPCLADGRLYCAAVGFGGVAVFPLDGSEPALLTPKTSPGMATGFVQTVAVLDGGMLGLASGQVSYVLWYDFKTRQWETIATSERLAKKTLLDYSETYCNGMVVNAPRAPHPFHSEANPYPAEDTCRPLRVRRANPQDLETVRVSAQRAGLAASPGRARSLSGVSYVLGRDQQRLFYGNSDRTMETADKRWVFFIVLHRCQALRRRCDRSAAQQPISGDP